jgi:hypothetical protein
MAQDGTHWAPCKEGGGGRLLDYQERLCCLELACQPALRGILIFVALALHFTTSLLDFVAKMSFEFGDSA